jgi:hypothetical protein
MNAFRIFMLQLCCSLITAQHIVNKMHVYACFHMVYYTPPLPSGYNSRNLPNISNQLQRFQ